MNGREKVEAAFSPEGSPEFAVMVPYESIFVRDHWSQLTRHPWWFEQSPDLADRMACLEEIIPAIGHDFMEIIPCPSRRYRQSHRMAVRPGGVFIEDTLTGQSEALVQPVIGGWEGMQPGYLGPVENPPQSIAEIEQMTPQLSPFDRESFIAQGHADLARWQLETFGADHYPFDYISTPFWSCYHLWGFAGTMAMVAHHPDLVRYACDRHLAHILQRVQQSAALGAAGVWIEDCMTDVISPAAYRELNLPYLNRLVAEIRSLGMHSIHYYCGNPMDRLDMLLESGADALALEESKKGFVVDILKIADFVQGRCTLFGNLDAINLLPQADEAALRAEIARQVAAGRRNRHRFVISLGSPVTPGTSLQRVQEYCRWSRELGS